MTDKLTAETAGEYLVTAKMRVEAIGWIRHWNVMSFGPNGVVQGSGWTLDEAWGNYDAALAAAGGSPMTDLTPETLEALADAPPGSFARLTWHGDVRAHAAAWRALEAEHNERARSLIMLKGENAGLNTEHFALTRLCGETNDALAASQQTVATLQVRVEALEQLREQVGVWGLALTVPHWLREEIETALDRVEAALAAAPNVPSDATDAASPRQGQEAKG